jgi:hypothetical protein
MVQQEKESAPPDASVLGVEAEKPTTNATATVEQSVADHEAVIVDEKMLSDQEL